MKLPLKALCMFKMTTIGLHLTHKLKLSMLVDVSSYFDDFQENSVVCLHVMYVLEYFLTGIVSCCPDVSVCMVNGRALGYCSFMVH